MRTSYGREADSETLALVTNDEVVAMARESVSSRQLYWNCSVADGCRCGDHGGCRARTAWEITMANASVKYFALFNLHPNATQRVSVQLPGPGLLFDVWRAVPAGEVRVGREWGAAVGPNSTLLLRWEG